MEEKDKFRHEYKYLCTSEQLVLLNARLKNVMSLDANVGDQNIYRIRSVYFDDYNNSNYYDNENGMYKRAKWRIRTYNEDRSKIKLEYKIKENTLICKKSYNLTIDQYHCIMNKEILSVHDEENMLLNRFILESREKLLTPKVIVGYERKPYIYKNGNVRVTFDMNIYGTTDTNGLFDIDIRKRNILPTGVHVLEVKFDEFIPDFIYNVLQIGDLRQCAFSKYYNACKYNI